MTVKEAYRYCKTVTQRYGPHFSIGFRFLPTPKQNAIYAVYAFCRYADDIVDEEQKQPIDLLLKTWEEELERCYQQQPMHPITIALSDAISHYPIPKKGFLGLIEGCRMDLQYDRYPTFDALMVYCDLVATTIRDLSLPVFGYHNQHGQEDGRAFATALQLTNIVRDIGEDLVRDRIYVPFDEIKRSGYCITDLEARVKSDAFIRLIQFQCKRIRGYFDQAANVIPFIDEDARLAVALMRNVYIALLNRIEARPFDILDCQIRLSWWERQKVIRQTVKDYRKC